MTKGACVDGASVGHMLFQMLSSGKTLSTKVTVKRPLAQVGFQVPSQGAGFPEGLGALGAALKFGHQLNSVLSAFYNH